MKILVLSMIILTGTSCSVFTVKDQRSKHYLCTLELVDRGSNVKDSGAVCGSIFREKHNHE